MELTILGSGYGEGQGDRHTSGYWIENGETALLLDAGDGLLHQIKKFSRDLNRLHGIVITHTHADHVSGLFLLLQTLHLSGRQTALSLWMPPKALQDFDEIVHWFGLKPAEWSFQLTTCSLCAGHEMQCGTLRLLPIHNGHKTDGESFSILVSTQGQRRLLYTSDVPGLSHLASLDTPVHCLLADATHLDTRVSYEYARRHGIEQLVFTHIPEAQPIWPSEVKNPDWIVAEDGMQLHC